MKFSYSKSNKYIIEKDRPIIPTIIYWSHSINNHNLTSFQFIFWKWWFKIKIVTIKKIIN